MVNKFIAIGNLTKDPELTQAGESSVCPFSIAVNNPYAKSEVLYIEVNFWNKTANNCMKFLKRGSQVYIEGRLKLNQWKDSKGTSFQKYFVVGENVRFLKGNIEETNSQHNIPHNTNPKPEPVKEEIIDEFPDVPF